MSWNTILKKRKLHSIYFQEFKNALLDAVKELPEGSKFYVTDMDIKNKFVENLKQTDIRPQDISSWVNVRLETWLTSIGNRIISNSGLANKVIGKVTSHIRKAETVTQARTKLLTDTEQLPDEEEDEEDEPVPEEEPNDDCLEYYRRITDVIESFVKQYNAFSFYPDEGGKYDFSTADFSYNFSGRRVGNKFKGSHMSKLVDSSMEFIPNDRTNYQTMQIFIVDFIYTKSENISRKDACRLLWLIHSKGWESFIPSLDFWSAGVAHKLNTYDSNALKASGDKIPNYGLQLLAGFKKTNIVKYSNYPQEWKDRIRADIDHFDIQAEYMMEKIVDIADEWVTNNFDDALKYRP